MEGHEGDCCATDQSDHILRARPPIPLTPDVCRHQTNHPRSEDGGNYGSSCRRNRDLAVNVTDHRRRHSRERYRCDYDPGAGGTASKTDRGCLPARQTLGTDARHPRYPRRSPP